MNKLDADRDMVRLAYLFSLMTADMDDEQMKEESDLGDVLAYDNQPAYKWAYKLSNEIRKARVLRWD